MKVSCIPIYSVISQNLMESYLATFNDSAPVIFRYCIQTGISINDVLSLTVSDVKQILIQGYVVAPPFSKRTSSYTIALDDLTISELQKLCSDKTDDAPIFSFVEGKSPSLSGFQRMLRRVAELVMPEDAEKITIFSLKKTFVLRQYQQNEDITEILNITGYTAPCRLKAFLGLSTEKDESLSNSRALLLENDYGKQLIANIKEGLDTLEKELYNPRNPDSFFQESYKNLTALANYIGSINRK